MKGPQDSEFESLEEWVWEPRGSGALLGATRSWNGSSSSTLCEVTLGKSLQKAEPVYSSVRWRGQRLAGLLGFRGQRW